MSEYFDKDKFTGDTPPQAPQPPRQRKDPQDDWDWLKWPLIIILFSLGLWPLAILAIAYFNSGKKIKITRSKRTRTMDRDTQERVERALRQAEARVAQARERVVREVDTTARPMVAQETVAKKKQETARQAESKKNAAKPEKKSKFL